MAPEHTPRSGRPDVTVVLPSYNSAATLADAADSVLNGNTVAVELIVIDDGSTDATADVLARLRDDARVRIISRPNKGLSASLNEGIAAATAEFIARMDADDVSIPGRLDAQVRHLRDNPDVVLVGGQIRRVVADDSQGRRVDSETRLPLQHNAILDALLAGQHALCHPAVTIRASALRHVGGYWSHGAGEDWDLFLRLADVGQLANLDLHVLDYSFHAGGINASSMGELRTNIALAVENYRRRAAGAPELDRAEYLAGLGRIERARIAAQGRSLRLYRKSMQVRHDKPVAGTALLAAAAAVWPPFAARRVKGALTGHQSTAGADASAVIT